MIPILYMDTHIVVCVKPAGIVSQDAPGNSVPELLRQQLERDYIGVIHRLDREVGGVMVYALSKHAAAALSRSVQERTLEKRYLAILCGRPAEPEGNLKDLLYHDKDRNKTFVVKKERKGVKSALLSYRMLQTVGTYSLIEVLLHTGRTHQIRVQFASRKLPLIGDRKYGGESCDMGLWSYKLAFPHPITGETMSFAELPPKEKPWNTFDIQEVQHVLG